MAQPDRVLLTDAPALPSLSIADVPRLLSESRNHNLNRIRYANGVSGKQPSPKIQAAVDESALALQKRQLAAALDPRRESPAWALDTSPHAELVEFLTRYPAIP